MLEQALEWNPKELYPGRWSTDWGTSPLRAGLFPQASANAFDRGRTIIIFIYRASVHIYLVVSVLTDLCQDAVIIFHQPLGGGRSLA